MAETIENKRYSHEENFTGLVADLTKAIPFTRIEENAEIKWYGDEAVRLWLNDNTCIHIEKTQYSSAMALFHKGAIVGDWMGENTSPERWGTLYLARTNTATLIAYDTTRGENLDLTSNYGGLIILSDAVNHRTGRKETVLSKVWFEGNNQQYYTYICASDTTAGIINPVLLETVETSNKLTVLSPIYSLDSATSLEGVYSTQTTQLSSTDLQICDCTFNGRKYFLMGRVIVPDE